MRRKLFAGVVAAAAALVPVWAMAGDQEFAQEIAASLRQSGQLHDYKIGVKCQDGTVWLRGRVTSQQQAQAALDHVLNIQGVKRAVNRLEIAPSDASEPQALQQAAGALGTERTRVSASAGWSVKSQGPTAQSATVARLEREGRSHSVEVMPEASPKPAMPAPTTALNQRSARSSIATALRLGTTPRPAGVRPASANMVVMNQPTEAPMPIGEMQGPQYVVPGAGTPPATYDQPVMPDYAWPSYASYPNYAALTYPKQYSPTAWPYIGPFYPYPQVPLGWRSVKLQWHDGWWQLDFDDGPRNGWFSGLFRPSH